MHPHMNWLSYLCALYLRSWTESALGCQAAPGALACQVAGPHRYTIPKSWDQRTNVQRVRA